MTTHHPSAAFVQPAVDEAQRHFQRCLGTAVMLQRQMDGLHMRLAGIGHPDRWQKDTWQMAREVREFAAAAQEHLQALVDFTSGLYGDEPMKVDLLELAGDALWQAERRVDEARADAPGLGALDPGSVQGGRGRLPL